MRGEDRLGRRPQRGDGGVTMVIVAGILGALLVFLALVIDLGKARSADLDNDIVVEQAALAGAASLSDGDATAACQAAWNYVEANQLSTEGATAAPPCGDLGGTCNPLAARAASGTIGGARFTFTSPVPAGDDLLGDQPPSDADRSPCDRFAVSVASASDNVVSPGSITLSSSAVAVSSGGVDAPAGTPIPLVLLGRTDCEVLSVSGSSEVRALSNGSLPGSIAIDSDGSDCKKNSAVVEVDGASSVSADGGAILLYSLVANPDSATRTTGSGKIEGAAPVTSPFGRSVIDDRYGAAIADLQATWASGSGLPDASFQRWTDYVAATRPFVTDACNISGGTAWNGVPQNGSPYPFDVPAGNWYIDCPEGLTFNGDGNVVFRGGNIVMDESMSMKGSTRLAFNCPSGSVRRYWVASAADIVSDCGTVTGDSIVVVRDGDALGGGGTDIVLWPRTFVYTPDGTFDLAGDKALYWTAPESGPFEDLLFWSESDDTIELDGNRGVDMQGIFFAPNAQMRLTGSRSFTNQGAQVILQSLRLVGNTRFTVYPVPGRQVGPGTDVSGSGAVSLIR